MNQEQYSFSFMDEMKKNIYVIGDIHGEFDMLENRVIDYNLCDCILICVGDLGVGFGSVEKEFKTARHLDNFFAKRNINFFSIRGNHDDPSYFNGTININHPHFRLLDDYETLDIDGKTFLFVGGAVSIDRLLREEGVSWWRGEEMVLDPSKISRCDVLITHAAPLWNGPNGKSGIEAFFQNDPKLLEECVEERKNVDILIKLSRAKKHYCGHFHISSSSKSDDCVSRILGIEEVAEIY
jgi:predicted phosphodiesterase